MVQSGAKRRGKTRKTSSESWQRARDLVATGRLSLREIAKELGIVHSTLLRRKEKEGWYDPQKEVDKLPPPPPTLKDSVAQFKKQKTSEDGGNDNADSDDDEFKDPPKRESFRDNTIWCQALLAWALEGVSKFGRNAYGAQCFLIEKLPNVIKALAFAGSDGKTSEEQAASRRKELHERFKLVVPPEYRDFDMGEVPDKKHGDDDS